MVKLNWPQHCLESEYVVRGARWPILTQEGDERAIRCRAGLTHQVHVIPVGIGQPPTIGVAKGLRPTHRKALPTQVHALGRSARYRKELTHFRGSELFALGKTIERAGEFGFDRVGKLCELRVACGCHGHGWVNCDHDSALIIAFVDDDVTRQHEANLEFGG